MEMVKEDAAKMKKFQSNIENIQGKNSLKMPEEDFSKWHSIANRYLRFVLTEGFRGTEERTSR